MNAEESKDATKPQMFNSQEFMEFLTKQVDISKLTVVTKSGDKISASFTGSNPSSSSGDSVFKSLEALKSLDYDQHRTTPEGPQSTVSLEYCKAPSTKASVFTSKDWTKDYQRDHVDVTYGKTFKDPNTSISGRTNPPSSMLPPKKRAGKTDWYGMYADALSPLVEAAARAEPEPLATKEEKKKAPGKVEVPKPYKRKPRKVIPEVKEYVETVTDIDVLFGRGGRSNHHPGNKIYRELVMQRQAHYRGCVKAEKTGIAQSIVDSIHKSGGRFLEKDNSSRWYIVPNIVSRRKVGQALRENNTREARAAKREKYGPGKRVKGSLPRSI